MMSRQFEEDIIGAIKIKDGLFIGDEFAAQVSSNRSSIAAIILFLQFGGVVGLRIRDSKQGVTYYKLRWTTSLQQLGRLRHRVLDFLLARLGWASVV